MCSSEDLESRKVSFILVILFVFKSIKWIVILINKIKHQKYFLLTRLVKAGFCLKHLLTSVIHFLWKKKKKSGTVSHISAGPLRQGIRTSSSLLSRLNCSILIIFILFILMPQSSFKMAKYNRNSMRVVSLATMTISIEKELLL